MEAVTFLWKVSELPADYMSSHVWVENSKLLLLPPDLNSYKSASTAVKATKIIPPVQN
jgi:hypothetical protein